MSAPTRQATLCRLTDSVWPADRRISTEKTSGRKLKACKDALDDLRVTQDRHAAIKADFTRFREQAKKEMAPGKSRLSITVAEDTATSFVIEHLDCRGKVAFHFDPGSGQGHVCVYDVTAKAMPSPLSDAPAVPLFDFPSMVEGRQISPPEIF